jgi:hypothetical protein
MLSRCLSRLTNEVPCDDSRAPAETPEVAAGQWHGLSRCVAEEPLAERQRVPGLFQREHAALPDASVEYA